MRSKFLSLASLAIFFYGGCKMMENKSKSLSPSWSKLEKINIIPCPKIIKRHSDSEFVPSEKTVIIIPENAHRKVKIGAELIIEQFKKSSGIEIKTDAVSNLHKYNHAEIIEFKNKLPEDLKKYPLEEQGYYIKISKDKITLSAEAPQGMLYAAVTLSQILSGTKPVPNLEIIDWPDFKSRGANSIRFFRFSQGKEMVDWLLKYKYNWILTSYRPDNTPKKYWPTLKKINEYAKERGVNFIYCASWFIGDAQKDQANPEYKGCIAFKSKFYCWSRDELIKKTALKYAGFINATSPAMVNFHCLDSPNENWNERCEKCKKRFGDDRVSADANVINIFTNAIRKNCKGVRLAFVCQPYGIDLDLPGNKKYFDFYKELSSKVPRDVAFNQTGYNKDAHLAINKAVSQPIIRWQNGSAFQAGRFFNTEPRLLKGTYFPERKNDIAFLNEPYGSFRDGDVMLLTGIEYMWNTEAPGASEWRTNKSCPIEKNGAYDYQKGTIDGKTVWGHGSDGSQSRSDEIDLVLDPPQTSEILLKRICISLYGDKLAPFMYDFYRIGIVGWWHPRLALKFSINEEASHHEYQKCIKAQEILKKALKTVSSKEDKKTAERFLTRMIPLAEFYRLDSELQKTTKNIEANKGISAKLEEIKGEIAKAQKIMAASGISAKTASIWLNYPEKQLEVLNAEAELRKKMQSLKNRTGIKIAIYYPNARNGKVIGAKTILKILSSHEDLAPVFIDSLKMDELCKYKVLILPHIRKFGDGDGKIYLKNIREFVKNGGGAYFEHDSVGFYRGVLNESIFPDICRKGFRRKEHHYAIPQTGHPCLEGITEKQKHLYWDHIALTPGTKGTVLLTDQDKDAVAIAGKEGKGRVVFNGMITYPSEKTPNADPAKYIDKKFLINCVEWLAGKEQNENSKEKAPKIIFSSDTKTINLSLKPGKKYDIWMGPPFKLEKGNKYLLSFELKKENSCRFIPILDLYTNAKRREKNIFINNFPYRKRIDGFQKFSGVIYSTDHPDSSARIKFFFDWFKNKELGKHDAEIKNISIYEMENKHEKH